MSRLLFSRGTWQTARLCEMLASARFSGLPVVSLTDLTGAARSPALHPALLGGGSGSVAEMVALGAVTAAIRPTSILEFGTCDGISTWHLWANSEASILTLDWPPRARPFLPKDPRVQLKEIDSRHWQPAPGDRFDLCFIDAGHDDECVRNDSEKALRCLSPGGTVLWHDATWRRDGFDVNRYLRELRRSGTDVRLLRTGVYDYCALAVLRDGAPAKPSRSDLQVETQQGSRRALSSV